MNIDNANHLMPYRNLCNGVQREEAKLSLALASELFCYVPLHKIRYGTRLQAFSNYILQDSVDECKQYWNGSVSLAKGWEQGNRKRENERPPTMSSCPSTNEHSIVASLTTIFVVFDYCQLNRTLSTTSCVWSSSFGTACSRQIKSAKTVCQRCRS